MLQCKMSVMLLAGRRDGGRCVCCDSETGVTVRARRSSDERLPAAVQAKMLTAADLVALCENDFRMIRSSEAGLPDTGQYHAALSYGWQVKSMSAVPNVEVPIYYRASARWFRVNADGSRDELHSAVARELIATAGGAQLADTVSVFVGGREVPEPLEWLDEHAHRPTRGDSE